MQKKMSYIKPVFIKAGGLFVDGYSRGELQKYLIRYISDILVLSLKIDYDNCWLYKDKKEAESIAETYWKCKDK